MKKVISFTFVLVIMCMFIVPSHAYGEDDIVPYGPVAQCPGCKYPSTDTYLITDSYELDYTVDYCPYKFGSHEHTKVYTNRVYKICIHCGYKEQQSAGQYAYTLCPYSSNSK